MTEAGANPIPLTPSDTPDAAVPPTYPERPDILVRISQFNDTFWNRHPHIERYRLAVRDGHATDLEQNLLIWLKPSATPAPRPDLEGSAPLDRPADLDLVFDTAHDGDLLADHPDVSARHLDLQVNEHANGAERRLRLWLRDAGGL